MQSTTNLRKNIQTLFDSSFNGLEGLFTKNKNDSIIWAEKQKIVSEWIADNRDAHIYRIFPSVTCESRPECREEAKRIPKPPKKISEATRVSESPRTQNIVENQEFAAISTGDEAICDTPDVSTIEKPRDDKSIVQARASAMDHFIDVAKLTIPILAELSRKLKRATESSDMIDLNRFLFKVTEFVTETLNMDIDAMSFGSFRTCNDIDSESVSSDEGSVGQSNRDQEAEVRAALLAVVESFVPCTSTEPTQFVQTISGKTGLTRRKSTLRIAQTVVQVRIVDYRHIIFMLAKAMPCELQDRVQLFFLLYGIEGAISIGGICSILYHGDSILASSLRDADSFLDYIDQDGDGSITWTEFQAAIIREPFLLEGIVQQHACHTSNVQELGDLKEFGARTKMSWTRIFNLWQSLVAYSKNDSNQETDDLVDTNSETSGEAVLDVLFPENVFVQHILQMLHPPEPGDSLLVRRIAKMCTPNKSAPQVSARLFVTSLATRVNELKYGTSNIRDKAAFYFSMYNMDGDKELSREEVYQMMFSTKGDISKRIMRASEVLREIDIDQDGSVSFEEYIQASKQDPEFFFSSFVGSNE